jgi:antagonist of KipI
MDKTSAFLCNMLVANEQDAALVEITGGEWLTEMSHPQLIVAGGKGFNVFVNDNPVSFWQPCFLQAGDKLRLIPLPGGGISYLAIHGGIRIKPVLNSRSTHLGASFGGFNGRLLRPGDLLPTAVLRTTQAEKIVRHICRPGAQHHLRLSNTAIPDHSRNSVRIIAGHEYDWFTPAARELLASSLFELTGMSNRMGYRFNGPALQLGQHEQVISSAVSPGTIQVSPDGQLLVLMADAQTTGGYPRIGQVISADLPLLAQKSAGCQLQFRLVTIAEAETVYLKREEQLANLQKDYALIFT